MALPQDFWQNEHMFHRFRSKPCQRLLRCGVCEWHSQCQFSHDPEWPRRPPSKHNYSPALCPHIRPHINHNTGEVQLENLCPQGTSCTFSHTKDEVLYHPSLFKTHLCEEHRSLTSDQRSARRSKHRPRCHRYYCPFAHGKQELRTSPLSAEQREAALRAVSIFPHGVCCGICSNNQLGPVCVDQSSGLGYSSLPVEQEASVTPANLWPGGSQTQLCQMALPGRAGETNIPDIADGRVWGGSPWLQQPLQQQVSGLDFLADDVQGLVPFKEQALSQALGTKADQSQQEVETNDGEIDVDSEIYERAVRFLDEISTSESGSEDQPTQGDKDESSLRSVQAVKESTAWSNNQALPPMWNPQEAWVADANGKDRWPGSNYWAMQSVDRFAA